MGSFPARLWPIIAALLLVSACAVSANPLEKFVEANDREDWTPVAWSEETGAPYTHPYFSRAESWTTDAYSNDFLVPTGFAETVNFSAFSASPLSVKLSGHQNLTRTGALGETVTLDLTSFVLRGHSTFTLEGTATTTFIINISKRFLLSGSAAVILSGGLLWQNVVFNVLGPGPEVILRGHSRLYGRLLALGRRVTLRGRATIFGDVRADDVRIRGAARIISPPLTSP